MGVLGQQLTGLKERFPQQSGDTASVVFAVPEAAMIEEWLTQKRGSKVQVVEAASSANAGYEQRSIGDIAVNEGFAPRFRGRYGRADGQPIPVKITRSRTLCSIASCSS